MSTHYSILTTSNQPDTSSQTAILDLAEQNTHQLIEILNQLITVLLDPDPVNQPVVKDLAAQYSTIVQSIKVGIISVQKVPNTKTFIPAQSTAHNDWMRADLSSLMVLDTKTAIDEMLCDLEDY